MKTFARLAILVFLAIGVSACSQVSTTSSSDPPPMAPPIAGTDAENRFMQLSDFRGKVVLLDFWFTHCSFCRKFEPQEKALVKKYEGRPFVILGVNTDPSREMLIHTQREAQLTWRSWWDGPSGPITPQWGVSGFPTIYLIDHLGRKSYSVEGLPQGDKLAAKIEQLVRDAEKAEQLVQKAEKAHVEGN